MLLRSFLVFGKSQLQVLALTPSEGWSGIPPKNSISVLVNPGSQFDTMLFSIVSLSERLSKTVFSPGLNSVTTFQLYLKENYTEVVYSWTFVFP